MEKPMPMKNQARNEEMVEKYFNDSSKRDETLTEEKPKKKEPVL